MKNFLLALCIVACSHFTAYSQDRELKPVYGINLYALNGELKVDAYSRDYLMLKERIILDGPQFGINRRKGRFYQELIFGGITRVSSKNHLVITDTSGMSTLVANRYDINSQSKQTLHYQAGWKWLGKENDRFAIISGLGLTFIHGKYQSTAYKDEKKTSRTTRNMFVYDPYIFSTLTYALYGRWGMNLTAQYSPYGFWNNYNKSEQFLSKDVYKDSYWMTDKYQTSSRVVWRLGLTYSM